MFIALAWGTLRVVGFRIGANLDEENKWSFGQLLPIILLFLPCWSAYEQLRDEKATEPHDILPLHSAGSTASSSRSTPPHNTPPLHKTESTAGSSRSTRPLNTLPPTATETHWSKLQLSQTKWFRKLQLLIFGLALVFAADVLYKFPLGPANPNGWSTDAVGSRDGIIVSLGLYGSLLGISVVILIFFTSACLALQPTKSDPSLENTNWVLESLFYCLIIGLVVVFFLIDWFTLSGPNPRLSLKIFR